MWNLNDIKEISKLRDAENRLVVARVRVWEVGTRVGGWEVGKMGKEGQMYKLAVLK